MICSLQPKRMALRRPLSESDVLVNFAARRLFCFSSAAVTSPYPRHVSRRRSVLLVIASQSFAINRQCDLKGRCGLDRGRLSGFRCAALLRTDQPVIQQETSPMTSQHQRDDSAGHRGDDGQPSKASQTAANRGATLGMDELNNSPQGCAMQRLVGHQRKPVVEPSLPYLRL